MYDTWTIVGMGNGQGGGEVVPVSGGLGHWDVSGTGRVCTGC